MGNLHSAEFYKQLNYSTTEFDKSIIFIASGALGISMAFIDKVVKLDEAHCKCLLILSWDFFGVTIFLSLVTHFVSVMANRWAIQNCPSEDNENDTLEQKYITGEKKWNWSIRGLNLLMIVGLLLGLFFFLRFIHFNI